MPSIPGLPLLALTRCKARLRFSLSQTSSIRCSSIAGLSVAIKRRSSGTVCLVSGSCSSARIFAPRFFQTTPHNVTDARLWAAARIAFAYAALRFTEGYGLWRGRTWAEWVALVSGALLLPLEVRELLRGVTALRCALFIGNLAVVFFMLYVIRSNRRERRMAAAGSTRD